MRPTPQLTARKTLLAGGVALTALMTGDAPEATAASAAGSNAYTLHGVIRDFKERTDPAGHPDFENRPRRGFARYSGNIDPTLGADMKPVFTGAGFKVASQWRDADWNQISHTVYDPSLGDSAGSWSQAGTGGINSADTFDQWFRDVAGVNISEPLPITLVWDEAESMYVFDDRTDPAYEDLGGFFPIDDRLYGNSGGTPDHNFHFTYEIHANFVYDEDAEQFFKFIGDDDVWVFIDDRLVIDLGGIHAAHDQLIKLDRLGLVDGETYRLDFFFAERHRTASNFRIETNLLLASMPTATFSNAFD